MASPGNERPPKRAQLCPPSMEAEGEITTARPFMEAKDLRAGVIQYKPPVKKPDEDWNQYIDRNVAEYDMICGQAVAERNCELLVFPEYGLTGPNIGALGRENLKDIRWDTVKEEMSAIAAKHGIYLVVNMLFFTEENDGEKIYNTSFAFDREGVEVARCVKYHLHGDEPEYLDAETLDVSRSHLSYTPRFTTDYGAVIGVMICFDINFFTPSDYWVFYSVDAIAFSAAWVDELPFLTALQYHPGWALANGQSLLAAGLHSVDSGSLGTGIYDGKKGIVSYTFRPSLTTCIVTVEGVYPVKNFEEHFVAGCSGLQVTQMQDLERKFLKEDLSGYNWKILELGDHTCEFNIDGIYGEVNTICTVSYNLEASDSDTNGCYVWLTRHDVRRFGGLKEKKGILVNGIVYFNKRPINTVTTEKILAVRILNDKAGFDLPKVERPNEEWSFPLFTRLEMKVNHGIKAQSVRLMPVSLSKLVQPFPSNLLNYTRTVDNGEFTTTLSVNFPVTRIGNMDIPSKLDFYSLGLYGRDFVGDKEYVKSNGRVDFRL